MTSDRHDENLTGQITEIDQAFVTVGGIMLLFETPVPSAPTNVQVHRRVEGSHEYVGIVADVQDASGQIRQRRWGSLQSGEMRFLDELT